MNLFRSEEHARNWRGFKSGTEEGIIDLSVLVNLFSIDLFTRRLDPDYFSQRKKYGADRAAAWTKIMRPFWSPKTP